LPDPFDQTSLLCDHFYELIDPLGRDQKGRPSVLRFEFIQPVALAGIRPLFFDGGKKQGVLSEAAWAILLHHFVKFACGRPLDEELEQTLRAYQDLVLEALRHAGA
jgi:hypothetical protein